MNSKKSYYEIGGEAARMYSTIDDYLELTLTRDADKIAKTRKYGAVIGFGAAAVLIIIAVVIHTLLASLLLVAFAVAAALAGVYITRYDGQYTHAKWVNAIIDKDGIDKGYKDFMSAMPAGMILVGARYLFVRGTDMARIDDVEKFYIRKDIETDQVRGCYISAEVRENGRKRSFDIMPVTSRGNEPREALRNFEKTVKELNRNAKKDI